MIYVFYGSDEWARSEALHALKATLPPDLSDLNITTLDGRKLKLDALVGACEALPFLTERRLVVVNDLLKHQKAGKERDEVRAYLERVPDTCDLVFVENEDIDKRNSLFTYIKKIDGAREFLPKEGAELQRWLQERAKILEVRLDGPAAQRLVEYVGNGSRALVNELAKLASYVGRGGRVGSAEVELLVNDGQEQNLFAFIDDLSLRRRGPALRAIRALLDEGQAATYILFMVARQVRLLLGVQELAGQRLRPDEIGAQLGQRPFVVRKALEQVRAFTADELLALHDRLLELDHATKTGRMEAETALEVLVLEVCADRKR
jgi:DNA polymerase III subunit delta